MFDSLFVLFFLGLFVFKIIIIIIIIIINNMTLYLFTPFTDYIFSKIFLVYYYYFLLPFIITKYLLIFIIIISCCQNARYCYM